MTDVVVATPDMVSLGVLAGVVDRARVEDAVMVCGARAQRSGGKLPPHVVAYLTMALCLFGGDSYEEVAVKVTGALTRWGCWDAGWSPPTASGITQARKRLGPKVLERVFESVAAPVATPATRGAWLAGRGWWPSTVSMWTWLTPNRMWPNSGITGPGTTARPIRKRGWSR
ncbi:transposase domain-containing protein [Nocardia sp. alder85J]|uniref:transposase domain-containing protein n=1 Tax=Nocardia sp. alder85J TaxID=2862949 RepID=UPI00224DCA8B|nr:transposase domain-containing protein [Nocardia sp. alder85J]MCX4097606.1 transposase domain-containing protein [Nocardia sp. alder85J]